MVHPFLRRRDGREAVTYPYPPLEPVLARTLGIPLFQEQAMRLAVVAAGFTPGEADELRRGMTPRRSHQRLAALKARLVAGMAERRIAAADAEKIFTHLLGFAGYGFPESHAASFALLVYASAWLKCFHPAVFALSLINSQPMGFYAPHTLVEDAKRHGVEVRGSDVDWSGWESTLEGSRPGEPPAPGEAPAIRLGLHLVQGLPRETGEAVVAARRSGPFGSVAALCLRAGAIDVRTVTEELTASWFGWPVRTFEAAVRPGALGWTWAMFAYKGWLRLSWLDENVLSKVVPDELFYNVCVTGTKPVV
jgi:error-prone DNA polymerase